MGSVIRSFTLRLLLDPELSPISSIVAVDPTLLLLDYFAVVARLKACLESTLCSLLTWGDLSSYAKGYLMNSRRHAYPYLQDYLA